MTIVKLSPFKNKKAPGRIAATRAPAALPPIRFREQTRALVVYPPLSPYPISIWDGDHLPSHHREKGGIGPRLKPELIGAGSVRSAQEVRQIHCRWHWHGFRQDKPCREFQPFALLGELEVEVVPEGPPGLAVSSRPVNFHGLSQGRPCRGIHGDALGPNCQEHPRELCRHHPLRGGGAVNDGDTVTVMDIPIPAEQEQGFQPRGQAVVLTVPPEASVEGLT